jgi:Raf kinase inhibitor-like YbhB/YbcL family protein
VPKHRDQQTPLDPEDRDRLERTRGQGTAGTGEDLLPGEAGGPPVRLEVTSLAFEDGEALPRRCAHDDENVSPPLEWSAAPDGTVELAVVCEDLDAPTGRFTHWVLSGIDPSATGVEEGEVPTGAVVGANGFGEIGWGGPQPPAGDGPHRYLFTVFASSAPLELATGAGADDLRDALEDNELARGELIGMAER